MSIFGQANNSLTPTRPRTALSGYGRSKKPTATLNSPMAPAVAPTPTQPPAQGINTGPTNPVADGNPASRGPMRGPMPAQPAGNTMMMDNNSILTANDGPQMGGAPQRINPVQPSAESGAGPGVNTGPMNPNQKWLNDIANRNEAGGNFYAPDSGGRAGWIARGGSPWSQGQPTGLGVGIQNNPTDNPILTAGGGNNSQISSSSPNEGILPSNRGPMGLPQQAGGPNPINPVQGINTGPTGIVNSSPSEGINNNPRPAGLPQNVGAPPTSNSPQGINTGPTTPQYSPLLPVGNGPFDIYSYLKKQQQQQAQEAMKYNESQPGFGYTPGMNRESLLRNSALMSEPGILNQTTEYNKRYQSGQ